GAVADVEIAAALDGEALDLRAAQHEGAVVARRIQAALGDGDQGAGERRALRRRGEAFEALVVGEGPEVVRHGNRLAAGAQAALADVEAHDALDALDADVEQAVDAER